MEVDKWKFLYGNKSFQISNMGVIRSVDRTILVTRNGVTYPVHRPGMVLSQRCSKENPHMFSTIQYMENDEKILKTIYIHKAVADHFVSKPNHILLAEIEGKATCASHIVKDYSNNRYDNIMWKTMSEIISTQPVRLADPTKSWRTRRKIYGKSGSKQKNNN